MSNGTSGSTGAGGTQHGGVGTPVVILAAVGAFIGGAVGGYVGAQAGSEAEDQQTQEQPQNGD